MTFTTFTVDVNVTDGNPHQVALYCLDWDGNNGRSARIDVLDAATGVVLDSRSVSRFSSGVYTVWNVGGHVTFRLVAGVGNVVLSGIFFN